MTTKPTIGRIVLYTMEGSGRTAPAMIVNVHSDEVVDLTVFTGPGLQLGQRQITRGDGEGQWRWPEKV